MRVLLIEDDDTIAEPLREGLERYGLQVERVSTGAEALRGPHGDIVLLDLGLPDMDGIDVCRHLRQVSEVPIIMLTARGTEADRVVGLEIGADDYLAKPFSMRELIARIRAVTRRTAGFPGAIASSSSPAAYWQPPPGAVPGPGPLHPGRLGAEPPHQSPPHQSPPHQSPLHQSPPHRDSTPQDSPRLDARHLDPRHRGAEHLPSQPWSQSSAPPPRVPADGHGFPPGSALPAAAPHVFEQAASTAGPQDPPRSGALVVDPRTRQVWVGETPVALTPKEFDLLALLAEDPGAVYSREQILSRVWDPHFHGPTKTLDVHVASLRRKLGDPAWIRTVRGVGFRLAVRPLPHGLVSGPDLALSPGPIADGGGSGTSPRAAGPGIDPGAGPGVHPGHAPRPHFHDAG